MTLEAEVILTTCAEELEKLREEVGFWRDMVNRGVAIYARQFKCAITGREDEVFDVYSTKKVSTVLDPNEWREDGHFLTVEEVVQDVKSRLNWKKCAHKPTILPLAEFKVTVMYNKGLGPQFIELDNVWADTVKEAQQEAESNATKYFEEYFFPHIDWEEVKVRPI